MVEQNLSQQLTKLVELRKDRTICDQVQFQLSEINKSAHQGLNNLKDTLMEHKQRSLHLQNVLPHIHPSLVDLVRDASEMRDKTEDMSRRTEQFIKVLSQSMIAVQNIKSAATKLATNVANLIQDEDKELFQIRAALYTISDLLSTVPSDDTQPRKELGNRNDCKRATTGADIVKKWKADYGPKLDVLWKEAVDTRRLYQSDERFIHLRDRRKVHSMKQICNMIGPERHFAKVATLAQTGSEQDDADVMFVTEVEAVELLRQGPCMKPLLITSDFSCTDALENFIGRLQHRESVDVQDTWSEEGTIPLSMTGQAVAEEISTHRNPDINPESKALNLLNLDISVSKYGTASNLLTQEANLGLAVTIDHRLDRQATARWLTTQEQQPFQRFKNSISPEELAQRTTENIIDGPFLKNAIQTRGAVLAGKKVLSASAVRDTSIEGCLKFMIAGQRGVFSGPHLDILNGTYIKCLSGLKIWSLFPDLSAEEEVQFEGDGDQWDFQPGRARLVVLKPGDTFFMPPGLRVVHAPLTLEDCIMSGGMVWDYRNIVETLENILYIARHPQTTNESLPTQLPEFLDALQELVAEQPSEFTSPGNTVHFKADLENVISRLKRACSCRHSPSKKEHSRKRQCIKECKCSDYQRMWYCEHVCGCKPTFGDIDCGIWCLERTVRDC